LGIDQRFIPLLAVEGELKKMETMKTKRVTIVFWVVTLAFLLVGTVGVYAAVTPPAPTLSAPSNDSLFTIESITLKWSAVPHDNGYYWVSWARAGDLDTWLAPPTARIHGTETTLSREYVRDYMVYNGNADTFYWQVQAEVDASYYWPESWSPLSESWSFNILKWPAAWIDGGYWEAHTVDSTDSLKGIDGEAYSKLLQYGSPETGWWETVGNGEVPVTVSPNAHLSWTDRSTDEQPKSVAFADFYRVQIAAASSFNGTVIEATSEALFYDTPELAPGAYYWRMRSETRAGLVTDWNAPRKFIIAAAPQRETTISCSVSPSTTPVGSPVTISGSITPLHPGSLLSIWVMDGGSWRDLASTNCRSDGVYSLTWTPWEAGTYQIKVSWDGDVTHDGSTSEAAQLVVNTPTTISCSVSPSEVTVGGSITVSGTIDPPVSGATVTLTYTKPDATKFTRTVTSGSTGSYSDAYKPDMVGSWSVSASWAGDATNGGASSSTSSINVKKSGCLIATTTYGSELSPQVQFLREFRDITVSSTFAGSNFMTIFNTFYYSFSPGVASTLYDNGVLREAMKVILYPLIGILGASSLIFPIFSFGPELGVVLVGLAACSLLAIVYIVPLVLLFGSIRRFEISPKTIRPMFIVWVSDVAVLVLAEALQSSLLMMVASGAFVVVTMCLATLVTARTVMGHFSRFRTVEG